MIKIIWIRSHYGLDTVPREAASASTLVGQAGRANTATARAHFCCPRAAAGRILAESSRIGSPSALRLSSRMALVRSAGYAAKSKAMRRSMFSSSGMALFCHRRELVLSPRLGGLGAVLPSRAISGGAIGAGVAYASRSKRSLGNQRRTARWLPASCCGDRGGGKGDASLTSALMDDRPVRRVALAAAVWLFVRGMWRYESEDGRIIQG